MFCVREDIPTKLLRHSLPLIGFFVEMNQRAKYNLLTVNNINNDCNDINKHDNDTNHQHPKYCH